MLCAVSICALPRAVQVCAAPPALLATEDRSVAELVTDLRELEAARKALRGVVLANRSVRFDR